jgi:hypothetical protein
LKFLFFKKKQKHGGVQDLIAGQRVEFQILSCQTLSEWMQEGVLSVNLVDRLVPLLQDLVSARNEGAKQSKAISKLYITSYIFKLFFFLQRLRQMQQTRLFSPLTTFHLA